MSETTTTPGDPTPKITTNGHNHSKQKRARSQLSCTPCRQGKLKCNRQHEPACDQCIKRNRESACVYLPPPTKNKPAQNVKGRIRQLENLVVDLMNQNQNQNQNGQVQKIISNEQNKASAPTGPYSQPTPPSDNDTSPQYTAEESLQSSESPDDVDAATAPFGEMKISKHEISYVGESHWGAILNSISDLKRDIGEEDEEEGSENERPEQGINGWGQVPMGGVQPHATSGLGFLLGGSDTVTKAQLISSVPEKKVADRLLSLWFNSPDPFKPIIHAPTFQDEYRRFWRSPQDTPVMWLGLLYAIMSLAASFSLRDLDPSSPAAQTILQEVNRYHSLSASAAVLSDFTKPKQHTLECLILYSAGLRSNNAFVNVWLMIGLIVRLALRMGYHRDPSHHPAISVFHGEMRRRVWSIISMIDVLISFQIGLPSIIKTIHDDVRPPRNLLDRDFSASTEALPVSRGPDELTPSSYTRAKLRIVRVFADAAELSHATVAPGYEETWRLDRDLEEAKAAIPPLLQMPDIHDLVTDPAEQLMCRFNIDLLYMKTKIVLHRRYMLTPLNQLTLEEQKRGIGTSRKACIDCALRVLQHHHTIYNATQTGGQLESVKWYMGTISTHDFLLAAMIICLELNTQINDPTFRLQPSGDPCPQRRAMMAALEKSQQIWSDASGRKRKQVQFVGKDGLAKGEHMFDETEKASRAMAVMIERVKTQMGPGQTPRPKDAPTPMTGLMQDLGMEPLGSNKRPSEPSYPPYNGILSTYEWGNMTGVPDDYGSSDQVFFANSGSGAGSSVFNPPISFGDSGNNTNGNSQSGSNDTSPDQMTDGYDQPDFTLIGDMLDVPVNLDWQMWDTQIIKGQQPSYGDLQDDGMDSLANFADYNARVGNIMTGGSGPVKPGNVILGNGTGPTVHNFSGRDFNLGMMNDIDFDVEQNITWPPLEGQGDWNLGSAPA